MKLVIAYIQPHRLDEVKTALAAKEVTRLSVSDIMGFGQQKGHKEVFRGAEFMVNLTKKLRLEIACNDDFLEPTIEAIIAGAKTGNIGDGKIIVTEVVDVVRIRTGERGSTAI